MGKGILVYGYLMTCFFFPADLPSIVSGSTVGMIDPHEKYFSDGTNRRTGYSWLMKEDRNLMITIPDQFSPYEGVFGISDDVFSKGSFNGTLFRFPLRKVASELSPTLYSDEKVCTLFDSFASDAHLVLLFLKHLESIELYVREESDVEPKRTFQVRISEESLYLARNKRMEFRSRVSTGKLMPDPVEVTYPITIETIHYSHGEESCVKRDSYLITNYFCGEDISLEFKVLASDESLSYLPVVGVAMATSGQRQSLGHLFCFLPLPVQKTSLTGLPVHVNGFFALSQNRRHIKYPTAEQEDQEKEGRKLSDKSLLWNRFLQEEAVPKAYVAMVMTAINEKKFNVAAEDVYK